VDAANILRGREPGVVRLGIQSIPQDIHNLNQKHSVFENGDSPRAKSSAPAETGLGGEPLSLLNLITKSQVEKKKKFVVSHGKKEYQAKLIIAGNIVQAYEYEKVRCRSVIGKTICRPKMRFPEKGRTSDKDKIRNLHRAQTRCSRLINANATGYDLFVTLTVGNADFGSDLVRMNHEFGLCIKRLEYDLNKGKPKKDWIKVKYIAVPEIQWKRFEKYGVKVWHFHVVLFGLGYIDNKKLSRIWKHGFVRINRINKVDNLGVYVTAYMEKDFACEELIGRRHFLGSIGLEEPLEVRGFSVDELLARQGINESCFEYGNSYKNEFLGAVNFRRYNLKKGGLTNERESQGDSAG
jgi:hypothetical protein